MRLGLFRDRPVFEESRNKYDAIVVPAHLAAYAGDGLWGFLNGVAAATGDPDPEFFIDPMTYWWTLPTRYWVVGSEAGAGVDLPFPIDKRRIRPTFRKLLARYGLLEEVANEGWAGVDSKAVRRVVTSVVDFQRAGITPAGMKAVRKYTEILNLDLEIRAFLPNRLVAPYIGISREMLAKQAAFNEAALSTTGQDDHLWAVAAFDFNPRFGALSTAAREQLHLNEFEGVGLWLDGFDEYAAPVDNLVRYADLAASIDARIWLMYGGYFSLIVGRKLQSDVSHGIYYTESKAIQGPVGSGPAAERYYVPRLHRFYEPSRAFRAIEQAPELACHCAECPSLSSLRTELVNATPKSGRKVAWAQRLQRHFLAARRQEVDFVNMASAQEIRDDLLVGVEALSHLSDTVKAGLGLDTSHLVRWSGAVPN